MRDRLIGARAKPGMELWIIDNQCVESSEMACVNGAINASAARRRALARPAAAARSNVPGAGRMNFRSRNASIGKPRSVDCAMKRTPLAWLRDYPQSPSPANLDGILDRLTAVAELGPDPALADASSVVAVKTPTTLAHRCRRGASTPSSWVEGRKINRQP